MLLNDSMVRIYHTCTLELRNMLVYLVALNIWYITSIGNNDTSILCVLKIT